MYGKAIRKENGYDANSYTYYPVAIIGAGESGIAMGCRLKEALGFDQFRIFDRQSGIGGTWWINSPAIFYSFSFCPNPDWTTFHPSGPEIVRYLQGVCDHYKIVDKIQLNTDVRGCTWLESEQVWEVTLQHLMVGVGDLSEFDRAQKITRDGPTSVYVTEEKIRAKILISAVGGLVEPNLFPKGIPGQERFEGEIFHSARWRYDIDLKDKDVVVVGTGCSAAQFVPRLTKDYGAKSVTQIMRSPPWWEKWAPRLNRSIPLFNKFIRFVVACGSEFDFRLFGGGEYAAKERAKVEVQLLEHMRKTAPEKYHEILTPDYGVGCKRRIFDASWFPGLNDPRIELTTMPLTSVSSNSVTLGPGRTYPGPPKEGAKESEEVSVPADVIVLANGFQTTEWLHPIEVTGRNGKKIHDVWAERGGPQMYMGLAMDGFPNFFTIFGPNTATGHSSVILASENMVNLSLKFIKPILDGAVERVEIKRSAEEKFSADIQGALKKTVWQSGGCQSWYKTESGWNSTLYPYSQLNFTLRCMFPTWQDWDLTYTPRGLAMKRLRLLLKSFAVLAAFVWALRLRRKGQSSKKAVKDAARDVLQRGALILQWVAGKL
ncbi:Baeyer-Villiger monooxygenase [Lachnellula suecica]|uniref:Baeyer-Villiger monooxygenase n=1 Tax=Lachnellula suecica TaxID=602035 RepID=A0A8T9C9Y1_9HELO|nr:Baeyer-Villiger monooxygenase [Lachnellula suecica]